MLVERLHLPMHPPSLHEALVRSGSTRSASGRTPFLLDRSDRCYLVAEGRVELFLVELRAGQPGGVRTHLCTVNAGFMLFGVGEVDDFLPTGYLAVAAVGTVLVDLALDRFAALSREHGAAAALLIDAWVLALSSAAAEGLADPPAIRTLLAVGETTMVDAGARVAGGEPLGWLSLEGRQALYLDTADVDGTDLFPLAPATWAAVGVAGTVSCVATADALATRQVWTALAAFHRTVSEVLPLVLRLGAADELNRLNRRVQNEQKALDRAETNLVGIVVAPHADAAPQDDRDALVAALQVIAREMRWTLTLPAASGEEPAPTLEEILKASGLRRRDLVLELGWWLDDIGPVLLPDGPGGPAALFRRGRRLLLATADGRRRRLGRADAARLGGRAIMLYESLPARPVGSAFLLRRAWELGRGEIIGAVGLSAVAGVLALLSPILTGYIAEDLIPSRDVPGLFQAATILLVIAALQFLLRLGTQRALLRLDGVNGTRLQAAIMDRVLRMPAGFFRNASAGETAMRITSLKASVDSFTGGIMGALFGISVLLSSLLVMFWSSPGLLPAALAAIAVLAGISVVLGHGRHHHEKEAVRLRGRISGWMLEVVGGVAKLRLAAAENRAYARWADLYVALSHAVNAAKRGERAAGLVMVGFSLGAQALLFAAVAGSDSVASGVWLGSLVTFLAAFNQAVAGASGLASNVLTLVSLKPSLEHASPILAGSPERSEGAISPGRLSGAVEIGAVDFSYAAGSEPVLQDLSLQIRAGEFVALVGPSGGGKSTIIRLLLGFETPQRGAILYDGKDLRSLDLRAVRAQMGVVLQRGRLFGLSLEENILGAHLNLGPDAAWRAAEEAGIADDIRNLPMGMRTIALEGALSGGQIQRILLARALVHRPRILLLDEATSALDNRVQGRVTDTLARLSATRIVVAHRLSTVAAADRIVVIQGGRVAESGSYGALMATGGIFAKIAARQLT